ncbi:unnamed protein product [Parascedosporium putredinis]|uniref:Dienelactone hydrolase domain-containing protein n=1 Tax=Parascedosporium putredinis TaxID=1442378 RepID=A0A9P1HCR6_9PEZI|nr:unnamed protein product [Parascedosporium putredinis]CAI8003314.1 unnamed protein product [Parascedosporium putredinis]
MLTIKALLALCAASDGDLTLYVNQPEGEYGDIAILYLTDVFGIQLNQNKLLVDSFSRAGFLTVAPDLFAGEPAPGDLNQPDWDIQKFLQANTPEIVDARIEQAITYLREELGATRIGVTGYCFGGRFAFRFGAEGRGADAVFAAHPSNPEDYEITNLTVAASIAYSESDNSLTPERRAELEVLLREADIPYQFTLYSGTNHGFAVRANLTSPEEKFGKESAFLQAVRWFEQWA